MLDDFKRVPLMYIKSGLVIPRLSEITMLSPNNTLHTLLISIWIKASIMIRTGTKLELTTDI